MTFNGACARPCDMLRLSSSRPRQPRLLNTSVGGLLHSVTMGTPSLRCRRRCFKRWIHDGALLEIIPFVGSVFGFDGLACRLRWLSHPEFAILSERQMRLDLLVGGPTGPVRFANPGQQQQWHPRELGQPKLQLEIRCVCPRGHLSVAQQPCGLGLVDHAARFRPGLGSAGTVPFGFIL